MATSKSPGDFCKEAHETVMQRYAAAAPSASAASAASNSSRTVSPAESEPTASTPASEGAVAAEPAAAVAATSAAGQGKRKRAQPNGEPWTRGGKKPRSGNESWGKKLKAFGKASGNADWETRLSMTNGPNPADFSPERRIALREIIRRSMPETEAQEEDRLGKMILQLLATSALHYERNLARVEANRGLKSGQRTKLSEMTRTVAQFGVAADVNVVSQLFDALREGTGWFPRIKEGREYYRVSAAARAWYSRLGTEGERQALLNAIEEGARADEAVSKPRSPSTAVSSPLRREPHSQSPQGNEHVAGRARVVSGATIPSSPAMPQVDADRPSSHQQRKQYDTRPPPLHPQTDAQAPSSHRQAAPEGVILTESAPGIVHPSSAWPAVNRPYRAAQEVAIPAATAPTVALAEPYERALPSGHYQAHEADILPAPRPRIVCPVPAWLKVNRHFREAQEVAIPAATGPTAPPVEPYARTSPGGRRQAHPEDIILPAPAPGVVHRFPAWLADKRFDRAALEIAIQSAKAPIAPLVEPNASASPGGDRQTVREATVLPPLILLPRIVERPPAWHAVDRYGRAAQVAAVAPQPAAH